MGPKHFFEVGTEAVYTQPVSIRTFIIDRRLDPAAVVVEYNRDIIATETFATTMLKDNDHLELLNCVGGG
ncbi:MAG: hypothetical protein [Olavius algarvensis Delta 4 endosymbiont]|nr:MAG: hypothetical protein [Olavius algarvensis Delta 4 endosymbiont]